jgi:hypothetical protein
MQQTLKGRGYINIKLRKVTNNLIEYEKYI